MARLITIFKDRKSPKGHTFILPHSVTYLEFYSFKRANSSFINKAVSKVNTKGQSFTFDIDEFLLTDN